MTRTIAFSRELLAIGWMLASCNGKIVVGDLGIRDAGVPSTGDAGSEEAAGSHGDEDSSVDSGATVDAGCGFPVRAIDVHPSGRIVPVYLAPTDATPADTASKLTAFEHALDAVQAWYGQQMGTTYQLETFRVEAPRAVASQYSRAQWDDFASNGFKDAGTTSCGLWEAAFDDLETAGHLALAGLPKIGTGGVAYIVVAGGGVTKGCAQPTMSVLEGMMLDRVIASCPNGTLDSCSRNCWEPGGLGASDPLCDQYPNDVPGYACASIGGLAYDLGIDFGLVTVSSRSEPDRSACAGTIMDAWWEYGRSAMLCDSDRAALARTGYLASP
jgi:hypothetical protein